MLKKEREKRKNHKSSSKNKAHNKKIRTQALVGMIILGIVCIGLIIALLINMRVISNPFTFTEKEVIAYSIPDECSLIVGQLIHTVETEDVCEQRCKTNCQIREKEYVQHEFSLVPNDCNQCTCYCE